MCPSEMSGCDMCSCCTLDHISSASGGKEPSAVLICKHVPFLIALCWNVYNQGDRQDVRHWSSAFGGISCFNMPPSGTVRVLMKFKPLLLDI